MAENQNCPTTSMEVLHIKLSREREKSLAPARNQTPMQQEVLENFTDAFKCFNQEQKS
jgi:hypothetical protein